MERYRKRRHAASQQVLLVAGAQAVTVSNLEGLQPWSLWCLLPRSQPSTWHFRCESQPCTICSNMALWCLQPKALSSTWRRRCSYVFLAQSTRAALPISGPAASCCAPFTVKRFKILDPISDLWPAASMLCTPYLKSVFTSHDAPHRGRQVGTPPLKTYGLASRAACRAPQHNFWQLSPG